MISRPKIVLGMSGGVDSSLAAHLLKEEHEVIGVTLSLHGRHGSQANPPSCGNATALEKAGRAAQEAGIDFHIIECPDRFHDETLARCRTLFERGCTPNPCHICNVRVKFVELLQAADRLGARQIATGHYARISRDSFNRPILQRGADKEKDQSYFLSGLSPDMLDRTVFPLGGMLKREVRAMAADLGLGSVHHKESQDLCFVDGKGHFSDSFFGQDKSTSTPGLFVDDCGNRLGEHGGIHLYTIGQRKGLGFATGRRMSITDINPATGTITVSAEKAAACSLRCKSDTFSWSADPLSAGERAEAQVRYRQKPAEAVIVKTEGSLLEIQFTAPVFGVTPGQILVLYKGDSVLGCGTITR